MSAVLEAERGLELPPEIPPFPVYRFTVDQYHRMVEAGILDEEEVRTELLEGWIVAKMRQSPSHVTVIHLIDEVLRPLLPPNWKIRIQSATTHEISEAVPDLAIVRGEIRDYLLHHPGPGDIALAVEVSESSLYRDRWKARIYARSGIPMYWLVNLVKNQIEVHSQPSGPTDEPEYGDVVVLTDAQQVPVVIDGNEIGRIAARDMLP